MIPRKLLLVSDNLEGGLGAAVMSGARYFRELGWLVGIAAPGATDRSLPDGVEGFEVKVPETARNVRGDIAAARAIRQAVHTLRPDVIHCHGLRSFLLCRAGGFRAYVTQHGTGPSSDDPPGYQLVRRTGLLAIPMAALGAFSASTVAVRGWEYLPHASPRLEEMADRVPTGLPSGELTLLWLGLVDPPKRPDLLIEGLAEATDQVAVRGLVAGGGQQLEELRDLAKRLGAPVTFLGPRSDVPDLIERAHAVVLLSDFWAGGFALQEAMWLGRTVIVSDLPEHQWLVGDSGLRCRNAGEVARAIRQLGDGDTAEALGRAAAARVRRQLDPRAPWPVLRERYGRRARKARS